MNPVKLRSASLNAVSALLVSMGAERLSAVTAFSDTALWLGLFLVALGAAAFYLREHLKPARRVRSPKTSAPLPTPVAIPSDLPSAP